MLGLVSEFPSVFEELRGSGLMLGLKTKIETSLSQTKHISKICY